MSEHVAKVRWERGGADFSYETYPRDHELEWGGGARTAASAALEYRGSASLPNPEELLVGALSSCHMLTFLAVCARKGVVVERYEDDARGVLEKNESGRLAVTRVTLRPRVTFAGEAPAPDVLARLHQQAHNGCFIAASVKTEVAIE
ncbi:MAG: OsmC family protein [Sandaracinaceae bacterium]|nr:OsmC family protein [Sandaracinaceae bacterium]